MRSTIFFSLALSAGAMLLPIRSRAAAASVAWSPGETVAFFGDSITQNGHQIFQLQLWQVLRHPGVPVRLVNIGKSGDWVGGAMGRWPWDGRSVKADRLFVMFGMNDIGLPLWRTVEPSDAANAAARERKLRVFEGDFKSLANMIAGDARDVMILTPSPYDVWSSVPADNRAGADGALARIAGITRHVASDLGMNLIDLHTPMAEFYRTHPELKLNGDRIHPGETGSLLMSTLIWKALGETNEIGHLELDAKGATTVSVEYVPKALPFPDSAAYRTLRPHWPLLEELNREVLCVRGLPSGRYVVSADEKHLGTYLAEDLSRGLNLALLETPSLHRSREADLTREKLRKQVEQLRSVLIYAHEAERAVGCANQKAVDLWLAAELSKPKCDGWRRRCLALVREHYPVLQQRKNEVDSLYEKLLAVRPMTYRLSVSPCRKEKERIAF